MLRHWSRHFVIKPTAMEIKPRTRCSGQNDFREKMEKDLPCEHPVSQRDLDINNLLSSNWLSE